MPGSLLLPQDTWSERSDMSTRSLDSKIGGKKVSFNKAVRVKQYPWKPDLDSYAGEHLTLPNSRFWFKVYKSKQDPPLFIDKSEVLSEEEENMEIFRDSLAPIAEDEDQDMEISQMRRRLVDHTANYNFFKNRENNLYNDAEQKHVPVNGYSVTNNYPVEPPVDYFREIPSREGRNCNVVKGVKSVWGMNHTNGDRKALRDNVLTDKRNFLDRDVTERQNGKQWEQFPLRSPIAKQPTNPSHRYRDDSPSKISERTFTVSNNLKSKERRSRSHDDHLVSENSFKDLRKADKSVSTEDLNVMDEEDAIDTSKFFKMSRDMATQCYGTLSKGKGIQSSFGNVCTNAFKRQTVDSSVSNGRNDNAMGNKSPRSLFSDRSGAGRPNNTTRYAKKEIQLSNEHSETDFSNFHSRISNILSSNGRNLNSSFRKNESKGKLISNADNIIMKTGGNATTYDYMDKPSTVVATKIESSTTQQRLPRNSELWKGKSYNRQQDNRTSSTIGYVRGRQIPLTDVSSNSHITVSTKTELGRNRNCLSPTKSRSNINNTSSTVPDVKWSSASSNETIPKKYSSSYESNDGRNKNLRPGSSSARNYGSGHHTEDSQSMIDWSLSGFQLATHPEKGITSISDSECTIHRRQPLLMYIPGVSHHNRPAVEDDRLSALSEMSRSELNDDLSPLASSPRINSRRDYLRRHPSLSKDGKLKWINWRNKGK